MSLLDELEKRNEERVALLKERDAIYERRERGYFNPLVAMDDKNRESEINGWLWTWDARIDLNTALRIARRLQKQKGRKP
jgi:hypothetical protein